ncbi:hypothetical protein [Phenylobacterium sp.]|jgi:hypothetical protein|uniref:hypothetical protein n=1 Tax=Phenylobacterium sp. TaxID=1871053 RepID=UPI002F95D078
MDANEQQVFALELIVACRLAMDPPETRRQLADFIGREPPECGEVEAAIRRRAVEIIRGADGPDLV